MINIIFKKKPLLGMIIIVVAFVAVWEGLSYIGILNVNQWPPPSIILKTLFTDLFEVTVEYTDSASSKTLLVHILRTIYKWLVGFILASIIGISIGFIFGISTTFYSFGNYIINVFRGLPSAAVWPVCILILGLNIKSQLFVITFGVIWPILINTSDAIRLLPKEIYDSLSFMNISQLQRCRVLLRCALPGIFTGLEIASAIAFLLTVTTEIFFPANGGIGWYLNEATNANNWDRIFAGLFLAAFLGWSINTIVHNARKKVVFWEGESVGEHSRQPLWRSIKLLSKISDSRLRDILTSDTVTKTIERSFKINVTSYFKVLYQGHPYFYPYELSKFSDISNIIQRDIRINIPYWESDIEKTKTILFARSWIDMNLSEDNFKNLYYKGELTIGQILEETCNDISYRDLGYKQVISEKLASAFGCQGTIELLQRSRMVLNMNQPIILIHEFIPV